METNPEKFGQTCRECIELGECEASCCGLVPIRSDVYLDHIDKIQKQPDETKLFDGYLYPVCSDMICPFLNRTTLKCEIYEYRPSVCRTYGLDDKLKCALVKKNGNKRSPAKRKQVQKEIDRFVDNTLDKMKNNIDENGKENNFY